MGYATRDKEEAINTAGERWRELERRRISEKGFAAMGKPQEGRKRTYAMVEPRNGRKEKISDGQAAKCEEG
jgi:hypothetical protein